MGCFKLGICIWGFPVQGPAGIQIAAEMGFEGVEIDLDGYQNQYHPLSDSAIQREYLRASKESGIEITSVSVELLNEYGLSNPMYSPKGKIAMEGCCRGLEAAAKMGVKVLQLPSFHDGLIKNEDDFWNTCEKISLLCEKAKESGVIIASENVLSIEKSKRMIEEVGSEQFKIMFDTQNYYAMKGYCASEHLKELYPYVAQIHIKDGYDHKISSALLGTGDSGFFETAEVIKATKCTKWLLLENYYNLEPLKRMCLNPYEVIRKDIEIAKKTFKL